MPALRFMLQFSEQKEGKGGDRDQEAGEGEVLESSVRKRETRRYPWKKESEGRRERGRRRGAEGEKNRSAEQSWTVTEESCCHSLLGNSSQQTPEFPPPLLAPREGGCQGEGVHLGMLLDTRCPPGTGQFLVPEALCP